ncbi:hypothetical protein NKG94_22030 [Micromonospora sp. M12]
MAHRRAAPGHAAAPSVQDARRRAASTQLDGRRTSHDDSPRSPAPTLAVVAALVAAVTVTGTALLTSPAAAAQGCQVDYTPNQWTGGFTANIKVSPATPPSPVGPSPGRTPGTSASRMVGTPRSASPDRR